MKRRPWVDYYPGFLYLFGNNGWEWDAKDFCDKEYFVYTAKFLCAYEVEVRAIVYEREDQIDKNGHYGVAWLECCGYPDCVLDEEHGPGIDDLRDMIRGLEKAEENLIRSGVPFVPDYKFYSPNKANLKRRNEAIRKRLNMKKWEDEAWNRRDI